MFWRFQPLDNVGAQRFQQTIVKSPNTLQSVRRAVNLPATCRLPDDPPSIQIDDSLGLSPIPAGSLRDRLYL